METFKMNDKEEISHLEINRKPRFNRSESPQFVLNKYDDY